MKVIDKGINDKRVRVIIGSNKYGEKGISKPIKTILIKDTTTEEVYKKIIEALNE